MNTDTEPFVVTPAHDLLLRGSTDVPMGLYHLHLMTAEQLTRLHYKPGMIKTVKKRLKDLVDHGYIQSDSVPTKRFRSPYYYTLGKKGVRYLEAIGMDIADSFRSSKETNKHYLFLDHALELNDVLIAALRLKFATEGHYLARYIHERTLKRTPYKVTMDGQAFTLIPDAVLDFRKREGTGSVPSLSLILEQDRGSEQQEHFKRRISAYRALLHTVDPKQFFSANRGGIAFTTFQGIRRVMQMRAWAGQVLHGDPQLAALFVFTELPRPLEPRQLLFERRWYTLANEYPGVLLQE